MRVIKNKLFIAMSLLLLSIGIIPNVQAGSLNTISDTMTNLTASETSSHDVLFDLETGNTFTAGETITIDFHEDDSGLAVDGASSAIADFDFNDGTERTVVAVNTGVPICAAGANNVAIGIVDATGVVTIEACSGYSASGSGATINVEYGTVASGTNRVTNPVAGTEVIDIGGTVGDTGKLAVVIIADDDVSVSTTVDPSLTFTNTNTTITLLTASSGNPTATATAYNSSNTLLAGTNATTGYTITYLGSTLTSGGNTITALSGGGASSTGSEQFGINLKDNATPNTGTEYSGGSGAPVAGYGTVDSYKFVPGVATDLASAGAPSADTTYYVSYIANIASDTQAGNYSTTITYICTGKY